MTFAVEFVARLFSAGAGVGSVARGSLCEGRTRLAPPLPRIDSEEHVEPEDLRDQTGGRQNPCCKLKILCQVNMASSLPEHPEAGQIRCIKGDLFSCPETDSLAHCISEDCRMGAGIAVLFKNKFNRVQELRQQQKKTGEVAILKIGPRFVYYLITKIKVSEKPTYENLRKCLEAMREHCVKNRVTDLSMPRIGCGLDRLQWEKVSAMLEEVFKGTHVRITVYSL